MFPFVDSIAAVSVFILSLVCIGCVIFTYGSKVQVSNYRPIVKHPDVNLNGTLQIISRDEWLAQPPKNRTKLHLPVPMVILGNTATEECFRKAICLLRVNTIQSIHVDSRKWDDIGYNFLIGNDGYVYEGRGWNLQGAHTKGFNNKSLGISFIGSFSDHLPAKAALDALDKLLEEALRLQKISEDYGVFCQRQLRKEVKSPGIALFEQIKTMERWREY